MSAGGAATAVAFRVDGPEDAPALVLSNSLGTTWALWEPQMAALTRRFRVVRYDLRGHGRSPVPAGPYEVADLGADIVALLDRLGVARAHLCGVSLGGMASLWAAAHAAERVDRLVVCSSSAQLGPAASWRERAAKVLAQGTSAIADAVVARWFTPDFRLRHPGTVDSMRALVAATSPEGYAACCEAIARMDLREDLAAVRAPTLVIAAADDQATPPAHAHRIAEGVVGSDVQVVERGAHLVNVERAEVVTDLIVTHLSRAPAAPSADREKNNDE